MWEKLKINWNLRHTSLLKWQFYKKMIEVDKQVRSDHEKFLGTLGGMDPKYRLTEESPDTLKTISGVFRWITVGDATVYTKINSVGRPYQVWLNCQSSKITNLLYEDQNQSCTVDVAVTRDKEFITINSNTRTTSKVYILRAKDLQQDCLRSSLMLVKDRQPKFEYYVDHAHGQFYIFTNSSRNKEFKVAVATDDAVDVWTDYYIPEHGIILQDMELYKKHVVLYGLKNLVPIAIILNADDRTKEPMIVHDEESCYMDKLLSNQEFEADKLYFWISSPVTPLHLLSSDAENVVINNADVSYQSSKNVLLSSQKFTTDRLTVADKDGHEVPLTMCYKSDVIKQDGSAPTLVHVYGCYGENVSMGYCPEKQFLLDRGWVLVFCHVRGGGELGRKWYYDGIGERKHNSFKDLYTCVEHIQSELKITQPKLTALVGKSAGSLPVAMFCNLWPHKIQAALLQLPLVNLLYSLSDSSSYLSTKDREEFIGDLRSPEEAQKHLLSICPYSSLRQQDYPAMYIQAARHDEVIPIESVSQYVQKLRFCIKQYKKVTDEQKEMPSSRKKSTVQRGTVLFNIDRSRTHYYVSRKEKFKETATQYSFLIKAMSCSLKTISDN